MPITLDEFATRMERLAGNIQKRGGTSIQHVAERTHQILVQETPVDTGLARSNWQIGVDGYIPVGTVAAISEGAALRGAREIIYASPEASSIAIVNNVPYIEKLNAGSSSQAPAGFVEAAVIAGERAAELIQLIRDGDI